MHLEKYESNGTDYLRLVRTITVKDENGKRGNRKKVIKTFGALSKYDDGKPEYMKRLRESFREGKPLISE
ncbi:MAG: hypothetical protein IJP78_13095, partial [Clostridia bacterium]|nr:hypothetical protein [Clostridia bacterium]